MAVSGLWSGDRAGLWHCQMVPLKRMSMPPFAFYFLSLPGM